MKPERWQQIEQLYYAALEQEAGARAAFLAQACGGDEALRREVESLLAAKAEMETFLVAPALEVVARLDAEKQSPSPVGARVSHYRILSLLGAGGMGEVYLAEDTKLGRKVALKLLPQEFTADRERVKRFEQEARATSSLNHPNIVTIYEIDRIESVYFIAEEYVEGQTLRERLQGGPMKLREALDDAIQIASALAAAHEAGVIHRDIKPENVMARRDGIVKVLDFGLAKLVEKRTVRQTTAGDSETLASGKVDTTPGTVMGTVSYMSPEQARGQEVDARTDIFSLGVVLYEMIAGRSPFEAATATEVMAAILDREPALLVRYSREATAESERIVSKALAKDREERYQTAKDLLIDLKNLRLELEVEAKLKLTGGLFESTTKDNADFHEPEPKPPRRFGRKGVVIAAVLMAVILGLATLISRTGPTLDSSRKVNYLDESPWTPSQVGWKIQSIPVPESDDNPVREKRGHLIKGDQVGLLGKSGLNPYSLYQDFKLDINISLVNGKGVAWVVRAKDFNNFCLFELYPPAGANGAAGASNIGKLRYSFYKNGKQKQAEPVPLTVIVGQDLSSINIHTEVTTDSGSSLARYFGVLFRAKSRFKVEARTNITPESKVLCDFEDENGDAMPYGGVGFYPRNGMEFLLLHLSVDPIIPQASNR